MKRLLPPLLAVATVLVPLSAHAANFTVTSNADDGRAGTLRAAIGAANADGEASNITFSATAFAAPRKTITLNGTQLSLANNGKLTITAPLAGVEISGDRKSRIFDGADDADVTMTGLTIRDGNPQGGGAEFSYFFGSGDASARGDFGGGIFNRGNLLLDGCTLFNNVSRGGGAIVSQNDLNSQSLTLRNCTLSDNSESNVFLPGAALLNVNGLTIIENSTIVGNTSAGSFRGAIVVTTIAGSNSPTRTEVRNSIIAGNTGDDVGSYNPATTAANKFQSNGYNLIGDGSAAGTFVNTGDQVIGNTAPGVAAFDDKGGPTPTRALLISSPAVNTGDSTLGVDQRGVARPQAGRADKGAFELEASNFTPSLVVTTLADEDNGTSDARVGSGTSLREAILRANSDGAASNITFAVSGTIRLTRALDNLASNGTLTISNAQTGVVTISGDANGNGANDDGDVGLFVVNAGADVTLQGLTLRDGRRNFGGAVNNNGGKLTLVNSTLTKNVAFADGGGAIFNPSANGVVTITNCTLSDNSATGFGGAISGGGSVFITDSTLSGNTSGNSGGAVNIGGPLEISGSTLSGNSSSFGGAISGPGAVTITDSTLSGNSANRFGGAISTSGTVTITGSKLSDNSVASSTGSVLGGAINSLGALTISDSTLSGNTATASGNFNSQGGAIYASSSLTITNSTLSGNTATSLANFTSQGGAIYASGSLTIASSTLSSNSAAGGGVGFGGAIYNVAAMSITDSTMTGNSARNSGGGIFSIGALTITRCTLSGNQAVFGAALYGNTASVTGANDPAAFVLVRNSTLSGNIASNLGGALRVFTGLTVIESSTLAGNSAPVGSGIALNGADTIARCRVVNSIIADNRTDGGGADSGSDVAVFSGTNNGFVSAGYNAIGDGNGTTAFTGTGDQTGVTAAQLNLGALAPNGGPTQTRALSFPSVAINSGDTTLGTDQRGVARPQGGRADKGAFELEAASFSPSLVVTTLADEDNGTSDARVGTGTSLREAILRANTDGVASEITFSETAFGAPRKTITLGSTALPALADNGTLTITAPAVGVEISGDKKRRVFQVNSNADVTMTGLTIRDGNASGNFGGGIFNAGKLTLDSCTLTGNSADFGGAVYSQTNLSGRTLTLRNCTLSGNTAAARGGGLRNSVGLSVIESCTIVGNEAAAEAGGGVASAGFSDTRTEVRNSIIAGNTGNDVNFTDAGINSFQSNGYNLIGVGNATGAFNASGDVINNTAPGVAALADNLGRVQTIALLLGSPAINAGDPAFNGTNQTDARGPGFARVRGGRLDIGAFEVQNSAPTVSGFNKTISEDGTLTFAASDFSGAFSDPDAGDTLQSVRIETLPPNGTLTLNGIAATAGQIVAVADIGKLTFVPAADFNGPTSFSFNASDGALFAANAATVSLTISSVNDAPSFTIGADQTVSEDAGAQSVAKFITNIQAGPANESGQKLNFLVTNDNNALFTTPPAIDDKGTLTYALTANAFGVATVSVKLQDDGKTANGGFDTSATQTFTISVNAVNDAPVVAPQSVTTNEDVSKAITLSASDVDNVTLTYRVINNPANGQLTGTAPNLTYVPDADFNGTDSFTFVANDGTADSAAATVSLTVNSVNDAPSFLVGADQIVAEASGVQSVANFATDIKVGPANESAQNPTFVVTNDNNALFSDQPAIDANGTLTYTPAPNAAGKANVSVTLQDGGGVANGGKDTSAAQSFVITVTANPINFGVSISPKAPFTNDTLTATPVILDDAGVTYVYEWFVNGQSVQKGASNTLDLSQPNFGDKGDVVSVTVSATNTRGGAGNTTNKVTVRNSAPFAFSGTASAQSGVEAVIAFKPFGNPGGGDSDGETLTYTRVGGPKNGTAAFEIEADGSIALRYTSRRGFVGVEAIRFVAVDGLGRTSNVATLGIDVKGVLLVAPTAKDASATATAGVFVDVPVTGNDPNGGAVTFKRVGGPRNGVGEFVTLANGQTVLRYQSRSNFVGVEEVRFVAFNSDGRPSNVATIRISVSASGTSAVRNNAPSAGNS